jgi:hypothetical protein
MTKLFTVQEFQNAKRKDYLPLKCKQCGKTFHKTKHDIIHCTIRPERYGTSDYCSRQCFGVAKTSLITLICLQCKKTFERQPCKIKKSKNQFCSQSCAATYNNLHKKYGIRRSKLEQYAEEQLRILYPNLCILFNSKEDIGSELDIYIPSLSLAFELNGIYHYEPIHGNNKFDQIQRNDQNKFNLCQKHGISLCIIDTSQQKHFTIKSSQKYLDIIISIIDKELINT